MPRIPKQWLNAVVYLYGTEDEAKQGARVGATGFVVEVGASQNRELHGRAHHYIVTNAHVVEKAGDSLVARVNLRAGGFDVLTIPRPAWELHPAGEDVAIAPILFDAPSHAYVAVNRTMILTRALLEEKWDFGPGDEAFFIGRYIDIEGRAYNVPTVRSGIVSALPAEPIFQPDRNHKQESFLVEARSYSGYSGSPVFITPSSHMEPADEFGGAPTVRNISHGPCFLLGIDWGHHPWRESVREPPAGTPVPDGKYVNTNSGMMMVVPGWRLLEVLDLDVFVKQREDNEREHLELIASSPVEMDVAESDDEYERFEDLTRKLVQTPKPK